MQWQLHRRGPVRLPDINDDAADRRHVVLLIIFIISLPRRRTVKIDNPCRAAEFRAAAAARGSSI